MKKNLCLAVLVFLSVAAFAVETSSSTKSLKHIVALKFKGDATEEQIKKVETEFRALKNKIPQVVALEWGTNVDSNQKNKGLTHCFVLTFKSEADLKTYLD